MAEGIIRGGGGGIDVSDANAKPLQVVKGYTFYSDRSEDPQIGTMPDMSGTSIVITPDETGTIPAGYHDGTGTIKADLSAQTAGKEDVLQSASIYIPNEDGGYVLVNGEIPERNEADIEINWSDSVGHVYASVPEGYYPEISKPVADRFTGGYRNDPSTSAFTLETDGKYAAQDVVISPYYTSTTPARTSSNITLNVNYESGMAEAYFPYGYYGTNIDKTLLSVYSGTSVDDDKDDYNGVITIEPTSSAQTLSVSGKVMRDNIWVPWDGPSRVATGRCTLLSGENQRSTLTYSDIDFIPNILMICSNNNSDSYEVEDLYYISYLFYSDYHGAAQVAGYTLSSDGVADRLTELGWSSGDILLTLNEESALVVGFNDGNAFWRPYNAYYAIAIQF